MAPAEGMLVTCFSGRIDEKVEFIVGDLDEEYLREYFSEDCLMWAVIIALMICFCLLQLDSSVPRKTVIA